MDQGTRQELANLLRGYRDALDGVEQATDDEHCVTAWRKVQTLGWRLHELLPQAVESLPA